MTGVGIAIGIVGWLSVPAVNFAKGKIRWGICALLGIFASNRAEALEAAGLSE